MKYIVFGFYSIDYFFTKFKKIPQILKTRKTQAAHRQVQYLLRCSPLHFGKKFRNQAAQHLVANHLFKLMHAFHIWNQQGKKETIDNLLMGSDINTLWKSVGNELGKLAKHNIIHQKGIINKRSHSHIWKFCVCLPPTETRTIQSHTNIWWIHNIISWWCVISRSVSFGKK